MAKKISTKAKPSERELYLIPDGCGPFVDAMLKAIRWGDDEDTSPVADWISDAEEALAFLQGLPDDLTPNDFDYSESGVHGLDALRKQGAREKKKWKRAEGKSM